MDFYLKLIDSAYILFCLSLQLVHSFDGLSFQDAVIETIASNEAACGSYGSPDWELLPIEDCSGIPCAFPQGICRYNFIDDIFSCFQVTNRCRKILQLANLLETGSIQSTPKPLPLVTEATARFEFPTRIRPLRVGKNGGRSNSRSTPVPTIKIHRLPTTPPTATTVTPPFRFPVETNTEDYSVNRSDDYYGKTDQLPFRDRNSRIFNSSAKKIKIIRLPPVDSTEIMTATETEHIDFHADEQMLRKQTISTITKDVAKDKDRLIQDILGSSDHDSTDHRNKEISKYVINPSSSKSAGKPTINSPSERTPAIETGHWPLDTKTRDLSIQSDRASTIDSIIGHSPERVSSLGDTIGFTDQHKNSLIDDLYGDRGNNLPARKPNPFDTNRSPQAPNVPSIQFSSAQEIPKHNQQKRRSNQFKIPPPPEPPGLKNTAPVQSPRQFRRQAEQIPSNQFHNPGRVESKHPQQGPPIKYFNPLQKVKQQRVLNQHSSFLNHQQERPPSIQLFAEPPVHSRIPKNRRKTNRDPIVLLKEERQSRSNVVEVREEVKDYHKFCCYWAQEGHCYSNGRFTRSVCQKSCGTPDCTEDRWRSCIPNIPEECSPRDLLPQKENQESLPLSSSTKVKLRLLSVQHVPLNKLSERRILLTT